jgi:hypothetical protein
MLCAEQMCLRALSELDQLEEGYLWCMSSGDPEAVATGLRLLGSHLLLTLRHLGPAIAITESELNIRADACRHRA